MADNEDMKVIWGRSFTQRNDDMQEAAHQAILYLKEKFQFEVCDVNFPDMHYYQYCYKRIDKDYDRVLEENKYMKTKMS